MKNGMDLGRLAAEPAIRFRPSLLLLAAFLSSAPLYPPNSYLMLRFASETYPAGEFLVSMLLTCLAAALVILLYSTQHPHWTGHETRKGRTVAAASAILYALALTTLWALLFLGHRSTLLFAMLGIVAGACIVPVIMRWVRLFLMDFRNVMFYGAIACASSSAIAWFVSLLPNHLAVASEGLLAVAGSVLPLLLSNNESARACKQDASLPPRSDASEHPNGAGDRSAPSGLASSLRAFLSIVWVPLLGFLVCSFMMSTYSFDISSGTIRSEYSGGIVASTIVVALCAMRMKSPLVILVDRLAIPTCIAACIVLNSFPTGTPLFIVGAMLVYAPLTLLSLFALSSLVAMAAAEELPLPFVFSAAFALCCTASLLGMTVQVNASPDVNLGSFLWIVLSIYFGAVVAHLGYVSWKQACSLEDPGIPNDTARNEDEADRLHALQHERVAAVADKHALTKREHEILQYLSLGYGSVYISKTLFISDNTARTHIRNIYRKLDVSSREELLSLVNSMGTQASPVEAARGQAIPTRATRLD